MFLPVTLYQGRLVIEASTTQVQQTKFCIILFSVEICTRQMCITYIFGVVILDIWGLFYL